MKTGKGNRQVPKSHLVLDGNALYEIDEECVQRKMYGQRPARQKPRSGRGR